MPENKNLPLTYRNKMESFEIENSLAEYCKSKEISLTDSQMKFAIHILSFGDTSIFARGTGKTFLFGILDEFIDSRNTPRFSQKQS